MKRAMLGTICLLAMTSMVWAQEKAPKAGEEKKAPTPAAPVAPAPATAAVTGAKIGHPAPSFTLTDTNGKKVTLADVLKEEKTQAVVLEWFNHECPLIQRHYKAGTMANLIKEFPNVKFFSIDSTASHAGKEADINKAVAEWKMTNPILMDDGKVGKLYGATNSTQIFVIDKKGVLVYNGAIDNDPDGKESKVINNAKVTLDQVLKGETVTTSTNKPYGTAIKYAEAKAAEPTKPVEPKKPDVKPMEEPKKPEAKPMEPKKP